MKRRRTKRDTYKDRKPLTNHNDLSDKNDILSTDDNVYSCHPVNDDQIRHDIEALSATGLSKKYPLTYNSWRNMKQRAHKGAIIHKRYQEFSAFLLDIGPRPNKDYSLDRIDTTNPTYGPGLCRWADQRQQSNNRGNSIYLTYKGECLPLTVWADRTNQKADTLRARKRNGWTDAEIITGKRVKLKPSLKHDDIPNGFKWPGSKKNQLDWELKYQKHLSYYDRNERKPDRLTYAIQQTREIYDRKVEKILPGFSPDPNYIYPESFLKEVRIVDSIGRYQKYLKKLVRDRKKQRKNAVREKALKVIERM